MNNIPWYKTVLAIVLTAIVGVVMVITFVILLDFIKINPRYKGEWLLLCFALFAGIICFALGKLFLKFSKSVNKNYYHTLWTGAWGVSVSYIVICVLLYLVNILR